MTPNALPTIPVVHPTIDIRPTESATNELPISTEEQPSTETPIPAVATIPLKTPRPTSPPAPPTQIPVESTTTPTEVNPSPTETETITPTDTPTATPLISTTATISGVTYIVPTAADGQLAFQLIAPRSRQIRQLPSQTTSAIPSVTPAVPAVSTEMRSLEIEYPPRVRLGDTDSIRLTFNVLPPATIGSTTAIAVTIQQPGHVAQQRVIVVPLPYDTYTITARAQLTMSTTGMVIIPTGSDVQAVERDTPITWQWLVQPVQVGTQTAIISARIEYTPKQPSAVQLAPKPLDLPAFTITIVTILGLSAEEARLAGYIGSILSLTAFASALKFYSQLRKLWPRSTKKIKKSEQKRRGRS
jgi:hypothetical protein